MKRLSVVAVLFLLVVACFGCATLVDRFLEDLQKLKENWKGLPEGPGEILKTENITCRPERLAPGEELEVTVEYSVRPSPSEKYLRVQEQWILKQGENPITTLVDEKKDRERGTYQVGIRVLVPKRLEQGSYAIEHKIETCPAEKGENCVRDTKQCHFEVFSEKPVKKKKP